MAQPQPCLSEQPLKEQAVDTPEYRFLASERATLQRLIERCGADEPISRASFEYRLQQVESELAAYEKQPSPLADARLSFRGQPVDGRRGMHADFLSKGAGEFAKAVHYIGASQRETPLPSTGPVDGSGVSRWLAPM